MRSGIRAERQYWTTCRGLANEDQGDTPPATENEIAACERKIGRPIPEPYRSFLREHNGGEPEPYTFAWTNESGRQVLAQVRSFFSVADDEEGLVECFETYRNRVPEDLFPIASEAGSNLVLLGVSGEHLGRVYYWDHNWEASDGEPATYRNVHPLAENFQAFLASLQNSDG